MEPQNRIRARSHADHYLAVREMLLGWSELWGNSVFHRFPEMVSLIPESWFRYGEIARLDHQFAVGQGEAVEGAPVSLLHWVESLRALCAFPRGMSGESLRAEYSRELTPKKRHEIEAILGFFRSENSSLSNVLDVGGGVGHLARHLALVFACSVISVDQDSELQERGRRILEKMPWREEVRSRIQFVSGRFPEIGGDLPESPASWSVGLHTCGETAWSHLELARKGYSVLNVGCCYEKLEAATGTQRSRFARSQPLPWTREALFLANRGGVERSEDDFVFQQRVLRYRFTLHELLLREGRDASQREAVGTASTRIYEGSFSGYVRDRVVLGISDRACEDFYLEIAPAVEKKRFITFIRNLLARPLETALLLDRALFIEESASAQARLIQLFEAKLSPRNVALVVTRDPFPS